MIRILLCFLVFEASSFECHSKGCVGCIAEDTCSSCLPLYNQKDNSCLTCQSMNPYTAPSEDNPLVVLDNGICVNKTVYVQKEYSEIPVIEPDETITLSFNSESLYDKGPCIFPLNKQVQYRPSLWLALDTVDYETNDKYYKLAIQSNNRIYVDFTTNTPGSAQYVCSYRQIIDGDGEIVIPFVRNTYYVYFSMDELSDVTFNINFTNTNLTYESEFDLTNDNIKELNENKTEISFTFPISTKGNYIHPSCAPTRIMKGVFFTISFEGSYNLLIDTTNQNRYTYIQEYEVNNNDSVNCINYWVSNWAETWTYSNDCQGLKIKLTSNSLNTRRFFIGTSEHSEDLTVNFSVICQNNCNEDLGYGKCSVRAGKCVCSQGHETSDCRPKCYYNNTFYKNGNKVEGTDMCYYGSKYCNEDCKCEDGILSRHYCVSSSCLATETSDDFDNSTEIECIHGSANCLENCVCDIGYIPTESHHCKIETCGNGILDNNEQCDDVPNCNECCICNEDYPSDGKGNCIKKPIVWYVWIIIAIFACMTIVLSLMILVMFFKFTKAKYIHETDFMEQQPTYYLDEKNSEFCEPTKETRYLIEPLGLDYGSLTEPASILETRYQTIVVSNRSKNKYLLLIVHTPNNPKYIFHFNSQVIILGPRKEERIISYMTLNCTTKIMGMKIPYSVYMSKHPKTLIAISELLKDKTTDTWSDSDSEELRKLESDIARKYIYNFEIKTESAASTHIDIDEVHMKEEPISPGVSSIVYIGKYRSNNVAVKMFKLDDLTEEESKQLKDEIIKQSEVMSKLRNPYIANYIGSVTYIPQISVIMQFFQLGSLGEYIHQDNPDEIILPYKLKIRILMDCSRGMAFLHENKIPHCDLKPTNLLISSLYSETSCVCKITDFGPLSYVRKNNIKHINEIRPLYVAPECFDENGNNGIYTNACDVYAFSIIAWELFYAVEPYKDIETSVEIRDQVKRGQRPAFDDKIPELLKELIIDCWKQNMNDRLSFESIITKLKYVMEDSANRPELSNVDTEKIENVINEKTQKVNDLLKEQID